MSKVFGTLASYTPLREERTRTVAAYDLQAVVPDGSPSGPATWHEVYFNHKRSGHPDLAAIRKAIIADINARTDERILSGFVWNEKSVWLSDENQRNFSEAQRVAMITGGQSLPMKFKLGEDAEGNPVYHEFTSVEELTGFYLSAVAYINQCLNEGWLEKDSIDMKDYGYE